MSLLNPFHPEGLCYWTRQLQPADSFLEVSERSAHAVKATCN